MRKYLIVLLALCCTQTGISQENFSQYINSYINKAFDITISSDTNKEFSLYINAWSHDTMSDEAGIIIRQNRYDSFINSLKQALSKYQEWHQVAKANNVRKLDKEMDINCNVGAFFLYGDEWHFMFSKKLSFDFKILESEEGLKHLLIIRTGKVQSSKNQYINCSDIVIVFSSAKEIQEFIDTISLEKINSFRSKPKAEDLFK